MVLAAETGSGKTLAYLAPLISKLGKANEEDGDALWVPSGEGLSCVTISYDKMHFTYDSSQ